MNSTTKVTYHLIHPTGAVSSSITATSRAEAIKYFIALASTTGMPRCPVSRAEEFVLTAAEYLGQFPQWRAELCKALSQKELA